MMKHPDFLLQSSNECIFVFNNAFIENRNWFFLALRDKYVVFLKLLQLVDLPFIILFQVIVLGLDNFHLLNELLVFVAELTNHIL